jgi:hypothetical protein
MEGPDLARVEQVVRQLCMERDIAWVAESVDAAVAEGFAESFTEGYSNHNRRRGGSPFGYGVEPDNRARIEPVIVERRYTDQERVLLLLDAMLAVYRDLPAMREETYSVLTDGFQGRVPVPDSIVSLFDEEDPDGVLVWHRESAEDREHRQRIVSVLAALREAVAA